MKVTSLPRIQRHSVCVSFFHLIDSRDNVWHKQRLQFYCVLAKYRNQFGNGFGEWWVCPFNALKKNIVIDEERQRLTGFFIYWNILIVLRMQAVVMKKPPRKKNCAVFNFQCWYAWLNALNVENVKVICKFMHFVDSEIHRMHSSNAKLNWFLSVALYVQLIKFLEGKHIIDSILLCGLDWPN